MSRTAHALRVRIAELRSKLMSDRAITTAEEEQLLSEIEALRGQVHAGRSRPPEAEPETRDDETRAGGPKHVGQAAASDRRRHPRFDLLVPIRFTVLALPDASRLLTRGSAPPKRPKLDELATDVADSADVSVSGIRFTSALPLPEETLVLLEVPWHGRGPRTLRVKAEIVRHVAAGEGQWESAARFVGLDRVTAEWLTHLRVTFSP